jgi:hypothetical protein
MQGMHSPPMRVLHVLQSLSATALDMCCTTVLYRHEAINFQADLVTAYSRVVWRGV